MLFALLFGLLFWCLLERRPPRRERAVGSRPNLPKSGPRVDRWSLPVVRGLTFVGWVGVFGELFMGRFPLGGLLSVGLFTLIGAVVMHEMKTYASASELALVPIESEARRGQLSRR